MTGKDDKNGGRPRPRPQTASRAPKGRGACPEGLNLPRASREEYVNGLREQVAELADRLDELESGMESAGWDDVGSYRAFLEESRLRLKSVLEMCGALEAAADRDWTSLRDESEEALLEAARSVEELAAGLEQVLPE